jgi:hypothetical protein
MVAHIILDANKATGKESLYLSAIGKRFRDRAARQRGDKAVHGAGVGGDTTTTTATSNTAMAGTPTNGSTKIKEKAPLGGGPSTSSTSAAPATRGLVSHGPTPSTGHSTSGAGGVGAGGAGIRDSGDWDERVANAWPVFCKYLNGRSALERIALQEDMKRKDVWNLLTAMSEYLLCVRHW